MSVCRTARKYRQIEKMKVVRINSGTISREQAEKAYRDLKSAKNHYDEKEIRFVNYTFGNIARHRERDRIFRIISQLEQLAAGSVPIYSEPERNPKNIQISNNIIMIWRRYPSMIRPIMSG